MATRAWLAGDRRGPLSGGTTAARVGASGPGAETPTACGTDSAAVAVAVELEGATTDVAAGEAAEFGGGATTVAATVAGTVAEVDAFAGTGAGTATGTVAEREGTAEAAAAAAAGLC